MKTDNKKIAAVYLPITDLVPWENNPRDNDYAVDAVANSIKRFGFGAPIVARKSDLMIIKGHTRRKAAIKLGLSEVPVRLLDISLVDAQLLALADNKLSEIADWNDNLLAEIIAELKEEEDISGLGFSDEEIERLSNLVDDSLFTEENEEPEQEELSFPVQSKHGEVYQLGPHLLICGDCRNREDMAKLFQDKKVNMVFTSPPYASQRSYDEDTEFSPIRPDDYGEWFFDVQDIIKGYLSDDGSFLLNIKEHCEDGQRSLYVKDLVLSFARSWGWLFVDELCWVKKNGGVPGAWNNRFKNGFEPVFHFAKQKKIRFNPLANGKASDDVFLYKQQNRTPKTGSPLLLKDEDTEFITAIARPGNVISICASSSSFAHPAQFPVELADFFIKAYSDRGDLVFDPFMGSGSTLISADRNKRVCFGSELSPKYCDIIRLRWTRYAEKNNIDPGKGRIDIDII